MRIFRLTPAAAFAAAAFVCGALFAAEPVWIFNNGDAADSASVGQGRIVSEFGLPTVSAMGTDCTVTLPAVKFSADERPFFALRYRYDNTKAVFGGLFFTTDTLPTLSDKSYSPLPVTSDGVWHNLVVDMRVFAHKQWKGEIRSFRFDPTNPSEPGALFAISRLGFFDSQKSANDFLAAANDEPNYALPMEIAEKWQRCVAPGGTLDASFERADYLIENAPELGRFTPKGTREEVVAVRKDASGKAVVEPMCDVSSRGFTTFAASGKGPFALEDRAQRLTDVAGQPCEQAARFVLARELMTAPGGKFRPGDKLTAEEHAALQKKLAEFSRYNALGEPVAALAKSIPQDAPRGRVAQVLMTRVRDALGTNVASPYSREYFQRDRLRVGAWGNFRPGDFDEEYARTYADCGFDFVLAMGGIPTRDLLTYGDKYGFEVYVNDGSYREPLVGDAEYCDHPSYTGAYVTDEPGSDDYDKLAAVCNPYKKATGYEAYVNLLPMYANAAQLKYGAGAAAIEYYDADPDLFRKYCAAFCEKFDTKYICTDIYPLNWTADHKKLTYADYVESINVIASVAREYDREFWCYIQTFAWIPSKRTPTEAEYRWQCYSMLSFGCKCILCWTYAGYRDEFPSLVDTKSRKTTAWHDARPVFWELRRLSDEYVKYRNIGAFTHNCTDDTPYLKMSNEYKDFAAIQALECEDPLLVGCFEKKDGSKGAAFTLVNMSELEENKGTTVRAKLAGTKAVAWYRGVPQEVKPNADGLFTFELASGEGVFVTVE